MAAPVVPIDCFSPVTAQHSSKLVFFQERSCLKQIQNAAKARLGPGSWADGSKCCTSHRVVVHVVGTYLLSRSTGNPGLPNG